MDPVSAFIMGAMAATAVTLAIQAYGRRKVRKALSQMQTGKAGEEQAAVIEMRRRVEALEQIVTEPPRRLAEEIASLR